MCRMPLGHHSRGAFQQLSCRLAVVVVGVRWRISLQRSCRRPARSVQNRESAFWAKGGEFFGGQDKRTWHYAAHVLEIIFVCTLFRWCASGTPFFTLLVPRFRAKPWRCWFSAGTMAAECAIFGSFGRDATMSGSGKIASSRSLIFPARYGNGDVVRPAVNPPVRRTILHRPTLAGRCARR